MTMLEKVFGTNEEFVFEQFQMVKHYIKSFVLFLVILVELLKIDTKTAAPMLALKPGH